MIETLYQLPNDAPDKLVNLLAKWQATSKKHLPTEGDLPFKKLVAEHPGLMTVEPILGDGKLIDLRFVLVGPEHDKRNGVPVSGVLFSEALHAGVMRRHVRVYSQVLESGEPHYWEITNTIYGAPPQQYVRLLLPIYDKAGVMISFLGSCVWLR